MARIRNSGIFFIDWNEFWQGEGEMGPEGCVIPDQDTSPGYLCANPGCQSSKCAFPMAVKGLTGTPFIRKLHIPNLAVRIFYWPLAMTV
jgi:hypothetical protein